MQAAKPRAELLETHMEDLMPLFCELLAAGKSVRCSPRGTSMLPMLRQGIDTVTISPITESPQKYDVLLYQRDNGQYILHRMVKGGETYTCIGDNQFVYERGVRKDQLIAVVTGFTRGEKTHSVTSFGYRCYCRFWHYGRFPRRVFRALRRRIVGAFCRKTGTKSS